MCARRAQPASQRRGLSPLTVVGVLLLAIGVGCLGWIGWQYIGTDVVAQKEAQHQTSELRRTWTDDPPAKAPSKDDLKKDLGKGFALLSIPSIGVTDVPIVVGVEPDDLDGTVGWYETTALPGAIGNFAVAGHRVTHGSVFAKLLDVKKGDKVTVETAKEIVTYTMDTSPADLTVKDTDGPDNGSWVLRSVPQRGSADVAPTQALITLTTCSDLFHSPDRSVGFGHLTSTRTK